MTEAANDNPPYLGMLDIVARWCLSSRPLLKRHLFSEDFPEPAFTVGGGGVEVWSSADIAKYEDAHPELLEWARANDENWNPDWD